MWLESLGTMTRTSTPRRAASRSVSSTCWSGMKYGVLIQMWCCARSIAFMYISRMGYTIWMGRFAFTRTSGSQLCGGTHSISLSGSRSSFHTVAIALRRPHTAGPTSRMCVSRHCREYREPMLNPPTNPIWSSTTRILEWLRPENRRGPFQNGRRRNGTRNTWMSLSKE